jgi:hypothetical protein
MSFLHKRIKMFSLDGKILDDSCIARMREQYILLLSDSMRSQGYVMRIDIDPDWSISYTGSDYDFMLSVYGAFLGKKNSLCIEALDKNRPIYIPKSKLDRLSQNQESK